MVQNRALHTRREMAKKTADSPGIRELDIDDSGAAARPTSRVIQYDPDAPETSAATVIVSAVSADTIIPHDDFFKARHVIHSACRHCWRDPQRLVNASEL